MSRDRIRFRIDPQGVLEIVDPDPCAIDVLKAVDPEFHIRTAPLEQFHRPRVLTTRSRPTGMTEADLKSHSVDELWGLHHQMMSGVDAVEATFQLSHDGGTSLMDLKIELAGRALVACRLCGHGCGVNRLAGELGKCGLSEKAIVGESFVHVAEEPPINPSLNINLMGCGLRCRFCQQFPLLQVRPSRGRPLNAALWDDLPIHEARSLSFVGGNPDESVYAILRFLREAPPHFSLPIVWNCHGFGAELVYRLLDGVVDCYVPDFKYWDDDCAVRWSGALGYRSYAMAALRAMVKQSVPVLVRLLVLPGHFECCHRPALVWLAREVATRIQIRVMGQYHPDNQVPVGRGEMGRRPTVLEVERVQALAAGLGLIPVEGTQSEVR